tara:strand:- start:100 stop:495 length:396 start_codon:yes stop_codon:yes gene_type:complete
MQAFKKRQLLFLLQLAGLTLALFIIHAYLHHYFSNSTPFFPIWKIYIFHFFVTTTLYTVVNYRHSFVQKSIFSLFMGITLLKMIFSIVFLLPLFLSDFESKKIDIVNFFAPYFLFLFFEILSLTRLLQNQE